MPCNSATVPAAVSFINFFCSVPLTTKRQLGRRKRKKQVRRPAHANDFVTCGEQDADQQ